MFLVDTNVFLEILLGQEKQDTCRRFLEENHGAVFISDFSLHSIGVILFRHNREDIFRLFIEEVLGSIEILSLPTDDYAQLGAVKAQWGLDFDDAYQYLVAQEFRLEIVTMDQDFRGIAKGEIRVTFL
ncbi:MAG TPA: PIN domain-containing protein [Candidatus Hydrogenedentes bacterium]|nr:PIN domain-containing protein [Candidatus Hydrogenedentota bacterium]HNT87655.1 PIN domain-containing protein [Candidatus Hydrogenedentota bacterium]